MNEKFICAMIHLCIYASLHYAKGVRLSNGRGKTSECTTIATIQSDQDWQDRSHDRWKGLGCTYARNATGRQRSAKRVAAWHQHAATTASGYANISTSWLFRLWILRRLSCPSFARFSRTRALDKEGNRGGKAGEARKQSRESGRGHLAWCAWYFHEDSKDMIRG